MNSISIILKNNHLITPEEFRALGNYSSCGQLWTVIYKPSNLFPHKIKYWSLEYIFEPEAFTIFCIISDNILARWDTEITREFGPSDELYLKDSIFITPYIKNH